MSEPVNDIVCTLLQKPFHQWTDNERDDLLTCERPTPFLDISVRKEVKSLGKVYYLKFKSIWYDSNKWLCGSHYNKKLYCWPCLILRTTRMAWNFNGFCDLKNANRAFKYHMNSEDHIKCAEQLKELQSVVASYSSTSSCSSSPAPCPSPSPSPPPTPSPPPPPSQAFIPTYVDEPINDLVCNVLQKPFKRWDDKDKRDIVSFGRPTPILDVSARRVVIKRGRSYNIKFRSAWYKKYEWLCGSYYLKKLYCWPCLLLGNKRRTWNFTGFCNLKNVHRSVQSHKLSTEHVECIEKLRIFEFNMKRDVENSIEDHMLMKDWSGTTEQPALSNSGMYSDAFDVNDAPHNYEGSLLDEFHSKMEFVKEEIVDSEDDDEEMSQSTGSMVEENIGDEADQLMSEEENVFYPAIVEHEPLHILNEPDEMASLMNGEEEKDEDILLNPEFIPVEEESDFDEPDQLRASS